MLGLVLAHFFQGRRSDQEEADAQVDTHELLNGINAGVIASTCIGIGVNYDKSAANSISAIINVATNASISIGTDIISGCCIRVSNRYNGDGTRYP